jgi:hypothetical protein
MQQTMRICCFTRITAVLAPSKNKTPVNAVVSAMGATHTPSATCPRVTQLIEQHSPAHTLCYLLHNGAHARPGEQALSDQELKAIEQAVARTHTAQICRDERQSEK